MSYLASRSEQSTDNEVKTLKGLTNLSNSGVKEFLKKTDTTIFENSNITSSTDTQVLFNDSDVLAGNSGLVYNKTTEILTVTKLGTTELAGNMTATNRIIVPMGEINYFNTTGTAIAIVTQSDGSTNMVVCNPVTTLNNDSGFDMPSDGRLRYMGTITKMFHIACTISFAAVAANDVFVIGIAKNGTVIAESKVLVKILNATDTASTALHVMTDLATNQYLELYVGNTTDADDFTIKTLTLFAMGL